MRGKKPLGPGTKRRWLSLEFAKLTGVTVRTLHHYDRLGLLKPGGRTRAGYRIYGESDLERLEQGVVLKFLGLSLKEIKALLDKKLLDLAGVLRVQRRALEEKRDRIDGALQAICAAEAALESGGEPDLNNIIEVIGMQKDTGWMSRYYN